ncbi:MAG: sugar phosphate isomerase/epimerase [Verrucomicrobia bacterium]|nr:sugar phosphate isomerase/epimerase [Verrucomicrobiota bacterium]
MIRSGLVSITFRKLSPETIVDLVATAGLDGIEWGGDVHVPHGDIHRAKDIRRLTQDAGLQVAAYGSYYRAAASEHDGLCFATVIETAAALGTSLIRVWPGDMGSGVMPPDRRAAVTADLKRIGQLARDHGIHVVCEFHGGSLTDTNESACQLMADLAGENVGLYWQPAVGQSTTYCLDGLRRLAAAITNLHVFHWTKTDGNSIDRRPLSEGEEPWRQYLQAAIHHARERFALLEYVARDDPDQFRRDAATLKQWLASPLSGDEQPCPVTRPACT